MLQESSLCQEEEKRQKEKQIKRKRVRNMVRERQIKARTYTSKQGTMTALASFQVLYQIS